MKRYFKALGVSPFSACIGIAGDDYFQIGGIHRPAWHDCGCRGE